MEVSGKKSRDVLSASQLHASDDDARLYCQPCDRDGSLVPAYGYCQDCVEHLCKSCYKVHLKPAPLKIHVLLDSSKMPQSQQLSHSSTPSDLTENCQLHSGKVIEYFCRDHNIFGCTPCITINHRTCKIDYIPDASKNYDLSEEYKHLLDTLKTLHKSCEKHAKLAKENKKKIQENQDAVKKEIRKFRQKIDRILDNWETEAVRNIDQLCGEEGVRVDSIDTECSKSIKEIEDLQKELKESHQSRKLNDLFCKAKTNISTMEDYATALTQMQENNFISNATFKRNSSIERIIKTEKCLGKFIFEKDEASHVKMPLLPADSGLEEKRQIAKQSDQHLNSNDKTKPAASSGTSNIDSQLLLHKHLAEPARLRQQASQQPNLTYDKLRATFSGKTDLKVLGDTKGCGTRDVDSQLLFQQPQYKHLAEPARLQQQFSQQPSLTYDKVSATLSGKIDMKEFDDNKYLSCDIQGIAVISRDLLAVTDFNNNKVKLVDTEKKEVVSSVKMSAKPFGVAVLRCDQLAVTIPDSSIIQLLSTIGGLSMVRQVDVDGECYGLAYSDGHFVVGFSDPGKVQIMTSEGKVLRTIQIPSKNIFIHPWYVTIDENNKTVYVSDAASEGRGIIRLNWEGEVIGVFKDSRLSATNGTFVLTDGSLLVCYYDDNSIQQVSPTFRQSRVFLKQKDGLSYPKCVALDREQNKLYVGCHHDNLLLFEIK